MRILIISRTPWDNSNSFGNTFSNLFGGMDGVEIYNICCKSGENNNSIVRQAYQMTDGSVLKSLKGRKAGHIMTGSGDLTDAVQNEYDLQPKRRRTIYLFARDIIWMIGCWWDKNLKHFLDDVNPDIIYLPLYPSSYMCDVQLKIVKYCKVPVVGHISDDDYNYPPNIIKQPLSLLYHFIQRGKFKKLIKKCSYVEVFADNMAKEYSKTFNKQIYIIGKGIDVSDIEKLTISSPSQSPIVYVYTGNIGSGRYKELAKLGMALDTAYQDGEAELRIYTKSVIDDRMKETLSGIRCLKMCGSVSGEEVMAIQKNADVLVHVESFDKESIFQAKMSFSTKLVDYMLAGKIIFAIGPKEVNSIQVLNNYCLAVCACSNDEILNQVDAIKNDRVDTMKLSWSIREYLKLHRDIKKIQNDIYARFTTLIN